MGKFRKSSKKGSRSESDKRGFRTRGQSIGTETGRKVTRGNPSNPHLSQRIKGIRPDQHAVGQVSAPSSTRHGGRDRPAQLRFQKLASPRKVGNGTNRTG